MKVDTVYAWAVVAAIEVASLAVMAGMVMFWVGLHGLAFGCAGLAVAAASTIPVSAFVADYFDKGF